MSNVISSINLILLKDDEIFTRSTLITLNINKKRRIAKHVAKRAEHVIDKCFDAKI